VINITEEFATSLSIVKANFYPADEISNSSKMSTFICKAVLCDKPADKKMKIHCRENFKYYPAKMSCRLLVVLLFYLEFGDNMVLQNVSKLLPDFRLSPEDSTLLWSGSFYNIRTHT
jgi:hypothetical protein